MDAMSARANSFQDRGMNPYQAPAPVAVSMSAFRASRFDLSGWHRRDGYVLPLIVGCFAIVCGGVVLALAVHLAQGVTTAAPVNDLPIAPWASNPLWALCAALLGFGMITCGMVAAGSYLRALLVEEPRLLSPAGRRQAGFGD
jgi:hypothetical protein